MLQRRRVESLTFGSFAAGKDAIANMAHSPNGALIDLTLERGHSGINLARTLRTQFPATTVALSSGYPVDSSTSETIISLGAQFIQKPISGETCRDFIAAVTLNSLPLHAALRRALLELCIAHDLGAQEARIVGRLAAGSTRARLARDLDMSDNTVKFQIRSLLAKTGMEDTSDVLADVLRRMSS